MRSRSRRRYPSSTRVMQSLVTPILLGYFGLGEVEVFAAVADQAAKVAFETVGHDEFPFRPADRALI